MLKSAEGEGYGVVTKICGARHVLIYSYDMGKFNNNLNGFILKKNKIIQKGSLVLYKERKYQKKIKWIYSSNTLIKKSNYFNQ